MVVGMPGRKGSAAKRHGSGAGNSPSSGCGSEYARQPGVGLDPYGKSGIGCGGQAERDGACRVDPGGPRGGFP